jgi:GntR family transcriptional regulator
VADDSAVSLGPTALAARDRLLAGIRSGTPAPGERLGAERELAERLGVSRSTIRAALADLERSGVIRRTRGRAGGIFVAERKVDRDLTSLAGLPAYLRRQGFESDARVLSTTTVEADAETAAALELAPGELVLEVVRVRLADGEPISLERARFPAARFPDLLDRALAGSLYELLETRYGLQPGEAEERIEVVDAGTAEARLLGLRRGAPLLAISRTTWDAEGRPFERSHDLFRADRARIVVRAHAAPAAPTVVGASVHVVQGRAPPLPGD